jgi:hypothetical protein
MAAGIVNGQEHQHALVDVQATTTGAPYRFAKFKSIKYKNSAPKKGVNDHQGQQVSYTIDNQKTEGSISMLLSEWFLFRAFLRQQAAALAAQLGRKVGIGQVAVDLTVQFGATLQTLQKDRIIGAMVQEEPRDSSDNQDALVVEVPLFFLDVVDGKTGERFIEYDQ